MDVSLEISLNVLKTAKKIQGRIRNDTLTHTNKTSAKRTKLSNKRTILLP